MGKMKHSNLTTLPQGQTFSALFRVLIMVMFCLSFTSCWFQKPAKEELWNAKITSLQSIDLKTTVEKENATIEPAVDLIIQQVFEAIHTYQTSDSVNEKSTTLFNKAIAAADRFAHQGLRYWVYSEVGFYYYNFSDYLSAAPYFIQISQALDRDDTQVTIQKGRILLLTAYFFETMKEYSVSTRYYLDLLPLYIDDAKRKGTIYYALGKVNLLQQNFNQAEHYYALSSSNALAIQDTLRYAKSLGGLGVVFAEQGQTDKAITYLSKDIELSKYLGENRNLMYGQLQLSKVYIKKGELQQAKVLLGEAYKEAASKAYLIGFEGEIVELLIDIAAKEGDAKTELHYRKYLEHLEQLMSNKEGEAVIREINWKADNERIIKELALKEQVIEKVTYQRLLLASLIAFILFLVFLAYRYYTNLIKKQVSHYETKLLSFRLDKINSENRLTQTNKTLAAYQIYLTEKTKQIKGMEEELTNLKTVSDKTLKAQRNSLEELMKSHLMTDENWQIFKEAFRVEQPEYMEYLEVNYPKLTETNLRIILLQKLGLTNQATADLIGVTLDAVKKAKQRLRKKYADTYEGLFFSGDSED